MFLSICVTKNQILEGSPVQGEDSMYGHIYTLLRKCMYYY